MFLGRIGDLNSPGVLFKLNKRARKSDEGQGSLSYEPRRLGANFLAGFTYLEVAIALAVIAVLATIIVGSFAQFRASTTLDNSVHQVLSAIRLAQSKTLAAESDIQHGVKFESDRVTVFEGATLVAGPDNEVTVLSSLVEITGVTLAGGGTEVVFDRLTGRTGKSGTVTLALVSDPLLTRTITIDASGQARSEAAGLTPAGTRVADTRHVSFALGWSIQDAATLRLQFSDPPNPDVINDIAMADYFNADKTSFDWEGSVSVGGSSQTLEIHTILLSPSDTMLSIHRDRRVNTKALKVYIDGKEIVTYDAAGNVTVGPFGGTMTIQ